MKKLLLISLTFIILFGCGRKSNPEYEENKVESKIILNLQKYDS